MRVFNLAVLTLLVVAAIVPTIGASVVTCGATCTYKEDFQAFNAGVTPSDTWYNVGCNSAQCGGMFQSVLSGGSLPNTAGGAGQNTWQLQDNAVPTGYTLETVGSSNANGLADLCTGGEVFTLNFFLGGAGIGTGTTLQIDAGEGTTTDAVTSQPINSVGVQIVGAIGAETVVAYAHGSTGAVVTSTLTTYTAGNAATLKIQQVQCVQTSAYSSANVCWGATCAALNLANGVHFTNTVAMHTIQYGSLGTATTGTAAQLDDIQWAGEPAPGSALVLTAESPDPTFASGFSNPTDAQAITGGGFQSGMEWDLFPGGSGCVAASGPAVANLNAVNSGLVTFNAPGQPAGSYDVRVRRFAGTYPAADACRQNFVTFALMDATTISPASGLIAGGTAFTITGANFLAIGKYTVLFDGNPATNVVRNTATSISGVTPNGLSAHIAKVVVQDTASGATSHQVDYTYGATGSTPATAKTDTPCPFGYKQTEGYEDFEDHVVTENKPSECWWETTTSSETGTPGLACPKTKAAPGPASIHGSVAMDVSTGCPTTVGGLHTAAWNFVYLPEMCKSTPTSISWAQYRSTNGGGSSASYMAIAAAGGFEWDSGTATNIHLKTAPPTNGGAQQNFDTVAPPGNNENMWFDMVIKVDCSTGQMVVTMSVTAEATGAVQEYQYTVAPLHVLGSLYFQQSTVNTNDIIDNGYATGLVVPRNYVAHYNAAGLVGFDVDPFDKNVIIRDTNGVNVRTLDPQTLLPNPVFSTSGCDTRNQGVTTTYYHGDVYASFTNCKTDGSHDTNRISMRRADLQDGPFQGTDCTGASGGNFCDIDLPQSGTLCGSTKGKDFNDLAAIPNDWSVGDSQDKFLAWAFSETNGNVGVLRVQQINNLPDAFKCATKSYANHGVVEMCGWHDFYGGRDVIAVGDGQVATPIGPYEINGGATSGSNAVDPTVSTLAAIPIPGPISGLKCTTQFTAVCKVTLVACGPKDSQINYTANLAAVLDVGSKAHVLHVVKDTGALGSDLFPPIQSAGGNTGQRMIAMDLSGGYIGFYNHTDEVAIWQIQPKPIFRCNVLVTSGGSPFDLRLDNLAHTLWVARTTYVEDYKLDDCTPTKNIPVSGSCIYAADGTCTAGETVDIQGAPDPSGKGNAQVPNNPTGNPATADCLATHTPDFCSGQAAGTLPGQSGYGPENGMDLFSAWTGIPISGPFCFILGFLVFLVFVALAIKFERPVIAAVLLAVGTAFAFLLFCFPFWIILLEFVIAAAGIWISRKGGN